MQREHKQDDEEVSTNGDTSPSENVHSIDLRRGFANRQNHAFYDAHVTDGCSH